MSRIYLVARREYLAYIATWGFWLSLLTAPLLLAALAFGPVLLARAEPPRAIVILADRPEDAHEVAQTFESDARDGARAEVKTYLEAAAPAIAPRALAAFDAAPDRASAVAAARALAAREAPNALGAFPGALPRYVVTPPPAPTIEGLRPYLSGAQGEHALYGALYVRRVNGAPRIEYWSVNVSQSEPSQIAQRAMREAMRREALAARGVSAAEAAQIDQLAPEAAQFDPRPTAPRGEVTVRDKAPFFAAILLAFVLWSLVFSVSNMLLSGVIEEKSNKIMDSLLTSVSPLDLLIGKLLGVAAVSATLLVFWAALGGSLLSMAASHASHGVLGQIAAAFLDARLITAFVVGFGAGYLLYGAIFLALGSLCDSVQEAQSLVGPAALVLALPMMLLAPALDNPNAPIIAGASWFPLFTPFLILIRAPSQLAWSEIAGLSAVMIVSLAVILVAAARLFHAGVVNQLSAATLFRSKPKR